MARLRAGAVDRVPLVLRERPGVPRGAALAALVIALVLAAALVSRAYAEGSGELTLPGSREAGRGAGPASAAGPSGASGWSHAAATSSVTAPATTSVWAIGAQGAPVLTGSPGAAEVVVDVAGRVRRPGLVRLTSGSRLWDAVMAAGGPVPGARLDRVNLARRLTDGEHVSVPGPDDPVPPEPPAVVEGAPADGVLGTAVPLDLNTATAEQLDGLPGVGPVLARRILGWRAQHGRFSRVEELGEVPGIGDRLLAQLRPRVTV